MKYYVEYMRHNNDDSALCIFDSNFGECKRTKGLTQDYTVPLIFLMIYLNMLMVKGEHLIIGSWLGHHIRILWVLVFGHKKWYMFPPCTPKTLIKPRPDEERLHEYPTLETNTVKRRPKLARHWLKGLCKYYPITTATISKALLMKQTLSSSNSRSSRTSIHIR
uniref:Innexin n=1 Tax=Syphacia muris TaxID=451379 RepID=A0A0N5AS60_9BILA